MAWTFLPVTGTIHAIRLYNARSVWRPGRWSPTGGAFFSYIRNEIVPISTCYFKCKPGTKGAVFGRPKRYRFQSTKKQWRGVRRMHASVCTLNTESTYRRITVVLKIGQLKRTPWGTHCHAASAAPKPENKCKNIDGESKGNEISVVSIRIVQQTSRIVLTVFRRQCMHKMDLNDGGHEWQHMGIVKHHIRGQDGEQC